MYISIIVPFSKNFSCDDIKDCIKNNNYHDNNEIKVSKKIRSLRELTKVEKELVKLTYKEAVLKCLDLKHTQKYIALKTKIWVDMHCLEFLKKSEEDENREWNFRLAKYHEEYLLNYKKSMGKIEQCEKGAVGYG